jgi:predicted phosphodiesterase
MMPAIQFMSDVHLEAPKAYDVFEINPKAPILALIGDIGRVERDESGYVEFLWHQLKQFRYVLLVLGNHEAYHSDWDTTKRIAHGFVAKFKSRRAQSQEASSQSAGDLVVLDRIRFDIPDSKVSILGCTLFSKVPEEALSEVSLRLNDFHVTRGWGVVDHNRSFDGDLAWLWEQVGDKSLRGRKVVVLTHHSPTIDPRGHDPKHTGSPVSTGFQTDLSGQERFAGVVDVWAFGHTHWNCDFVDEKSGIRFVTNQRGYYFQQSPGFDPEKLLIFE